ncbi:undecaprenyldiphospho-muramoylpentapeptide beta-N-acetylglucosaminyltransferase [bacterium]|nr:MAG: undecaprenyldiphospho-muramoylpentapeptide beta-N-acetylglucosaminyltransferase [bacterium]
MRIVVSGGGTGGHVTPVLALCVALRKLSKEPVAIDFIGSGSEMERQLAEENGLMYHAIRSGKLRRYGRGAGELLDVRTITANTRDAWRLTRGLSDARQLLRKLNPDVVFVKGGYVGLPVGLAARRLKLPLVIHESDTVMGMTNRVLSTYAQVVATGFPADSLHNIKSTARVVATGNPVRQAVLGGNRVRAQRHFGLDGARPTILFIGGSLGAHAINQAVFSVIDNLVETYNVIHQTGDREIDAAMFRRQKLADQVRNHYVPQAFFQAELADAYALADIVVTRCGANVLAELALLSKPTILVPLPNSANGHQLKNAQYLLKKGAARMIEQSKLTPITLRATIDNLADSASDQKYLGQALHRLAEPDAAERLAEIILSIGGQIL